MLQGRSWDLQNYSKVLSFEYDITHDKCSPEVIYTIIDHLADIIIGPVATFLPVATPTKGLQVVYISSVTTICNRNNMIYFEEQIVTKARIYFIKKHLRYTAYLAGVVVPLENYPFIVLRYNSPLSFVSFDYFFFIPLFFVFSMFPIGRRTRH